MHDLKAKCFWQGCDRAHDSLAITMTMASSSIWKKRWKWLFGSAKCWALWGRNHKNHSVYTLSRCGQEPVKMPDFVRDRGNWGSGTVITNGKKQPECNKQPKRSVNRIYFFVYVVLFFTRGKIKKRKRERESEPLHHLHIFFKLYSLIILFCVIRHSII